MPESMSESQVKQFIFSMQDQGVAVTRTKKGLLLRLPNGESTSMHFTNSDIRAKQNLIARLRRAGVRHPDDNRKIETLPVSITESGNPAPRTVRAIMEYVESNAYPEVVTVRAISEISGMEHITITRGLYHLGFLPTKGRRNSRDWITPDDILSMGQDSVHMVDDKPELEEEEVDRFGTPVADQEKVELSESVAVKFEQTSGREFIDSVDSWVVDLTRLPLNMPIGEYLQSLAASGLAFEVRVWRA